MPTSKEKILDTCHEWLEDKGASYLAKENQIVYYASITGRKSDFQWYKMSLEQVCRIITTTKLAAGDATVKPNNLVQSCQELGRVYDFGVTTRHETVPEVFNYLKEADMDLGDAGMAAIVEELYSRGYHAVLLEDVRTIHAHLMMSLGQEETSHRRNEAIHKHFPAAGYVVRTDKYRPQVDGRKQPAAMLPHTKPRDIVRIPKEEIGTIRAKIYGALK